MINRGLNFRLFVYELLLSLEVTLYYMELGFDFQS